MPLLFTNPDRVKAHPIFFSAPTNFNSGVSIRVASRSEMLEKISSGYGKVISVFIWVLSQENMSSGFPTK